MQSESPPKSEKDLGRQTPADQSRKAPKKRREQQRAVDTRLAILKAALPEFAEKGFDGASTRNIGDRANLHHPLITYHFRTKDALWRAVAEHAFTEIGGLWDQEVPDDSTLTPKDRVREEFRIFLRFTIQHPDFHLFMLRENVAGSPRLPWLVDTFLRPIISRVLPQIKSAQEVGEMPEGDPVLVYYMLIGMVSALSSLGAEMRKTSGVQPDDPAVVDAYWALIEKTMFRN